jgi:arylsulfatase
MDLAPTFLELAGTEYPAGGTVQSIRGESINAFLSGASDAVHDENYITVLSHKGRALLRQGKWKLSNLEYQFDEAEFELFDLDSDPGETHNLAESEPEIYQELLELWRTERKNLGIVLPQDL